MIDLEATVRLHPHARHRPIGDEGIVLHQQTAEVMVVNELGSRTLELLGKQATTRRIIDALSEEYEVERETLEQDVMIFLQELSSAGIISVRPT